MSDALQLVVQATEQQEARGLRLEETMQALATAQQSIAGSLAEAIAGSLAATATPRSESSREREKDQAASRSALRSPRSFRPALRIPGVPPRDLKGRAPSPDSAVLSIRGGRVLGMVQSISGENQRFEL